MARLQWTDTPSTTTFANATVGAKGKLRILRVILDGGLSLDSHVDEIMNIFYFHVQAPQHIRPLLSREVANTIACYIIAERTDHCNLLLAGVSEKNLDKLQHIQN